MIKFFPTVTSLVTTTSCCVGDCLVALCIIGWSGLHLLLSLALGASEG